MEKPYQYFSADSTTTVLPGDAERRVRWYLDGVTYANDPAIAEKSKIVIVLIVIVVRLMLVGCTIVRKDSRRLGHLYRVADLGNDRQAPQHIQSS